MSSLSSSGFFVKRRFISSVMCETRLICVGVPIIVPECVDCTSNSISFSCVRLGTHACSILYRNESRSLGNRFRFYGHLGRIILPFRKVWYSS